METNREPEKLLILSLNMAYFRDKLYLLPNLFLSFSRALDFALTKAGKDSYFKLKTEQKSTIAAILRQKRDVPRGLPTGFGKSFVFHLLSDVFAFVDSKGPPANEKAITVVISRIHVKRFLRCFDIF